MRQDILFSVLGFFGAVVLVIAWPLLRTIVVETLLHPLSTSRLEKDHWLRN